MNYDVIGPFKPKSRAYAYVLTCVDQYSRWPEAVPLRNLYSKTICGALLWIFAPTGKSGIPSILVAGNATHRTSNLSDEFRERLEVTSRITIRHTTWRRMPSWNATTQWLREWSITWFDLERPLPFLLWAYREMPNATTWKVLRCWRQDHSSPDRLEFQAVFQMDWSRENRRKVSEYSYDVQLAYRRHGKMSTYEPLAQIGLRRENRRCWSCLRRSRIPAIRVWVVEGVIYEKFRKLNLQNLYKRRPTSRCVSPARPIMGKITSGHIFAQYSNISTSSQNSLGDFASICFQHGMVLILTSYDFASVV